MVNMVMVVFDTVTRLGYTPSDAINKSLRSPKEIAKDIKSMLEGNANTKNFSSLCEFDSVESGFDIIAAHESVISEGKRKGIELYIGGI